MCERKKILIIDDDPDFVFVTQAVLQSKGYQCSCAYSAKQGLRKIKETAPDLIILDIMMENLTAGFRLVTELKMAREGSEYFKYSEVPILVVSNIERAVGYKHKFQEIVGTSLLPVEDFIRKPAPALLLLEKAQQLISARSK
jgi:two-component system alkaline phosphatase synthesis response regulator PhoP